MPLLLPSRWRAVGSCLSTVIIKSVFTRHIETQSRDFPVSSASLEMTCGMQCSRQRASKASGSQSVRLVWLQILSTSNTLDDTRPAVSLYWRSCGQANCSTEIVGRAVQDAEELCRLITLGELCKGINSQAFGRSKAEMKVRKSTRMMTMLDQQKTDKVDEKEVMEEVMVELLAELGMTRGEYDQLNKTLQQRHQAVHPDVPIKHGLAQWRQGEQWKKSDDEEEQQRKSG
ncbi:hypothetical protein BGX28_003009 [Mortierella sp. GBA30]|nr:hypothetical protein BGX28_003009 [Mortierella sp. GBA30]